MEKLFLHVCCGPCACWPLEWFQTEKPSLKLELWYFNPNIHPQSEFRRRRDSLAFLAAQHGLSVDFSPPYDPKTFFRLISEQPDSPQRCRLCYRLRFQEAAREAARRGHPAFATTLAFSKRQKHELIIEEGRRAAGENGLSFFYEDWRPGWQRGHERAKALGLYRQNYCGCLFSEMER